MRTTSELRILGHLEVRRDGRLVRLARGKQRVLLGQLLVHRNTVVSSDRLIEALWHERPPDTAATALQGYVSQLRKLLGPGRLLTQVPGYMLRVEPGELDADRFERFVEQGNLAEALALWRGPALADFAYEPFAQLEIVRLEEERLAALEQRIEQELGLGPNPQLVGELQALVAQHPFRERLRGQLMRALYVAGRQADALEAFQQARRALVDELGIEPSEELKGLQHAILAHDPVLGSPREGELVAGARSGAGPERPTFDGASSETTGVVVPVEERKIITALSADLVGLTGVGERLEPEEAELVVREAVTRMVFEVERFGGYVKDGAGEGILSFFGAPVSSEDDAERAVRAALAMVEEIRLYAGEVAHGFGLEGLAVRVGLGTGLVVVGAGEGGGYSAAGGAVDTAMRLQAGATPGCVLADAATERLVAPLFEWAEPLELDEAPERILAHPVERSGPRASKPRGLEGVAARLVGRERELALVRETVSNAVGGSGGIIFVTGEAGIGKSRLLLELRRLLESAAGDGGVLWLEGRCVSYGDSLPLWPFRELLREWLGVGASEPELRVRIALRRATGRLFGGSSSDVYPYLGSLLGLALEPDAAARLAELSPEALQYRTFEVVGDLLRRLSASRLVVAAFEDLHWGDATSVQLVERLLGVAEDSPVLFVVAQRDEPDHPSWWLKEVAGREFPHLMRELALEPLTGDAERELLHALVGPGTLPADLEFRLLEAAEGNPFYLEELVRSLLDRGSLARVDGGWRFDHEVPVEVPPTVEKVILARVDRLQPGCRVVLAAASALGRRFALPLLEDVVGANESVREALHELRRLDLVRASGRWPEPEFRFTHVLIQEAVYGTLLSDTRRTFHRRAAECLERRYADNPDEALGELAHHWLAAEDEDKAVAYLTRAGDHARREWALDEAVEHYRALLPLLERRGERQETVLVRLKLGLALHTALRFADANQAFQEALDRWEPRAAFESATATLRFRPDWLPAFADPPRSYFPPDMQLQMALLDRLVERWPEATIVPSLAEGWEVSADGLRYIFRLREGLRWSDGEPLTAADIEYGIKRSLDPKQPGVSVSIYFVLEGAQDYALGRTAREEGIGVRALDDRTIEFRLVAPAPYFLSVVNRPDGGPQPRHAIERCGDNWLEPEHQAVSGAFQQVERTSERIVLKRRHDYQGFRSGNIARVEILGLSDQEAAAAYARDELDVLSISFMSDMRTLPPAVVVDAVALPPAVSVYLAFDHAHPEIERVELRRALAHAIDRETLGEAMPSNFLVATGGIVPPALQGHTPAIAPRFDPDLAREWLRLADVKGAVALAGTSGDEIDQMLRAVAAGWQDVLGLRVELQSFPPLQITTRDSLEHAAVAASLWFPGYPDPEYFLRLLLHSEATDNIGRWAYPLFDELIERARRESYGPRRLELFHAADRIAVSDQVAVIPLAYARNAVFVKPWVRSWWEFGKSWPSFADLTVTQESPRHH